LALTDEVGVIEVFSILRFPSTPFRTLQEPIMAVQQNKKSPSKRGMHRSHNALNVPGIALEPTTGETHLRHHISPNGFYRGRKVLKSKSEA
jgi:large subunit ribosomal protein L32